jgi:hypothetical protein
MPVVDIPDRFNCNTFSWTAISDAAFMEMMESLTYCGACIPYRNSTRTRTFVRILNDEQENVYLASSIILGPIAFPLKMPSKQ